MYDDSTLRFDSEKGFSESYYIICPVCWNSSIKVLQWEDGTIENGECITCKRTEELMDIEDLLRP